jgi:squalene synthase HpnC
MADEIGNPQLSLQVLEWWGHELRQCYAGSPAHPVFVALRSTIQAFDIPMDPFADLLTAFRQDQTTLRYATWQDVLHDCRYSANPVGRLVLYLGGYRDKERQSLSDFTCTALQLANFWQDVSRDLDKNRIYIPLDILEQHGLNEGALFSRNFDDRYRALMRDLVVRTRALFEQGMPLIALVDTELQVDIELFSRGGMSVLDAIEAIGYNTLQTRPALSKMAKLRLLSQTYAKRYRIGSLVRALSQSRARRGA